MSLPINIDVWRRRYHDFKKIDYANSYYDFWKWKLDVELSGGSILDDSHRETAFDLLAARVGNWMVYRPLDLFTCLPRLKRGLEAIQSPYENIRKYDLLSFNKAPRDQLKIIWNKLGSVKETRGDENPTSCYFTVAATKPLMFIWGQTLAFDDYVRKIMPTMPLAGIDTDRWTFTLWYTAMNRFQEWVLEQEEYIEVMRETARTNFGSDELVPYGQFIDLYYWLAVKKRKSKKSSTSI
jgi:hypothetical protein